MQLLRASKGFVMTTVRIAGIDMSPMLESVAARLAHLDSAKQAEFFSIFAKELRACCVTEYDAEMQAAYVANDVNEEFKDFCSIVSAHEW